MLEFNEWALLKTPISLSSTLLDEFFVEGFER